MMRGIRQTLRTLWREKAFSLIAIAMLTLGVGETTALFSVVNVVLLQSSYDDTEQLYVVDALAPSLAAQFSLLPVNARHFDEWRSACTACQSIGLLQARGDNLTGGGSPERLRVLSVTHDLLPTLGIAPVLGRSILPSDDQPGAPPVVLLTDSFWRGRFQADPSIVGRDIRLSDRPVTVVGVLPPFEPVAGGYLGEFGLLEAEYEAVRPLRLNYAGIRPRGNFNFGAVVRLRPGATPQQAEDQMNAAISDFAREFNYDMSVQLRPLAEAVLGDLRAGLWLLFAGVAGILLIVCVNLGNLMLVRAERRDREAAVRSALGATSTRLIGQVMKEGIVLAFLGGAAGILAAHWAIAAVIASMPVEIPRLAEVGVDWTVLGFCLVVTTAAGLVTSILPALRYRSFSVQERLREAQATATGSFHRVRSRGVLVALEVALSSTLLAAASLMGVSFFKLVTAEKGFTPESVLSFDVALPPQTYPDDEARVNFNEQLIERLAVQPGVRQLGLTTKMPLEGHDWGDSIGPSGANWSEDELLPTNFRFVSSGYWKAMGIPLLAGRMLEASDRGRRVSVVSEEAARRLWPGESSIGKRYLGGPGQSDEPYEVVGVVSDVRTTGFEEQPVPTAYIPYGTTGRTDIVSYALRVEGDPNSFVAIVRESVGGLDPALPITDIRTMDQIVERTFAQQRLITTLATLFSAAALLLAALGIYGVVSYVVARRTSEIGLRMALGAKASGVLAMVLSQGMRPILAGLVMGMMGAVITGRYIESLLFETDARSPAVLAAVAALLVAVSALACYVPARRAASIDPITALRHE